jgi:hypothetical protein
MAERLSLGTHAVLGASGAAVSKPRRENVDTSFCPFCSPHLEQHYGFVRLHTGGSAHLNPWPLVPEHLVVVPAADHLTSPVELTEQFWAQFFSDIEAAIQLITSPHAIAGCSLGNQSASSVDHLHAQVLGIDFAPTCTHKMHLTEKVQSCTTLASDAGVECLVPPVGLTGEVLLRNDGKPLATFTPLMPKLVAAYAASGWYSLNVACHGVASGRHLHVRPSPTRQAGLEDALGMPVSRVWGPELVRVLGQVFK